MSRPKSKNAAIRVRPAERVRRYIVEQEQSPERSDGRLPTMRDLAVHLSVSLATVQTVYRELKESGRIITRTGDGAFLASPPSQRTSGRKRKIFINPLPLLTDDHNSLQAGYYGALLQAIGSEERAFDLASLVANRPLETQVEELYKSGELEGMVIFPFVPCQPLVDRCDQLGVPYVTIHPANYSTTANFVTPDFFVGGVRLGEAIRASGRKRVALLVYGDILKSSTAWSIVSGMCSRAVDDNHEITLEQISHLELLARKKNISDWFEERRHNLPDVILCHWTRGRWVLPDLLAKMKVAVPADLSLISGLHSSHDEASSGDLTRFSVACKAICERALDMLTERIARNGEPLPGVKLPLSFAGGGTTSSVENRLLGL